MQRRTLEAKKKQSTSYGQKHVLNAGQEGERYRKTNVVNLVELEHLEFQSSLHTTGKHSYQERCPVQNALLLICHVNRGNGPRTGSEAHALFVLMRSFDDRLYCIVFHPHALPSLLLPNRQCGA